jgi:ligand-binding sensor domain-containing protein
MENIPAGQTIGPYRIIQQIGQGGMATVFKAYQPAMDRYVALKILPRQLAESPEFIGRFRQEARTIARLEHAHILPVHDYGDSGSYTYLVMRFVEAGTLKDRLQAGPLPPEDIDRYFLQLADALDYAHAHGVVHRDLKPSNVLLDQRGDLFLTDFGIAKLLETDSSFTGTGALIGTPAYMSPEQAQGLPVDRRTDIYSLGIMLYEMVVERLPFEADTPLAIILKQISAPLPMPSSMKPGISPAIEQVLLKALAKNPADRYATMAEFSAAWRAANKPAVTQHAASPPAPWPAAPASRPPLPAAPAVPAAPAAPAAAPSWSRRFTVLAAGGLLAAGVVVCGALLTLLALNQQRRLSPPRPTTLAAEGAPTATPGPPGSTPAAVIPGAPGHWRSWAAGNFVLAVAQFNGQLVSGGPGSVTTWNLAGGTVAGRLTTANGLPEPHVDAIVADDAAKTLWIGTAAGVTAFDGQHTTLYDRQSGLDSNDVKAMAHTRRGLLVGTAGSNVDGGGLNLFAAGRWQPVGGFPSVYQTDSAPDHLSTNITALLEDSKGNWWVGTSNGLGFYDGQTWKRFSTFDGLPDNQVTALAEADGAIWAGTNSGLAHLASGAFAVTAETQGKTIRGLFAGQGGDLWVTGDSAIARRATGSHWQTYDQSNFPANVVFGGLQASDGMTYFATDAGVLRFDGRTFELWSVPNVPNQPGYALILAHPSKNQLWFVDNNYDNTDVLDLAASTWSRLPTLPCDACIPVAWGSDGRLWAASGDGMWIIQGNKATHVTASQGLPSSGTRAFAFGADGSTWVGTDAGLARYEGTAVTAVFSTTNAGLADDTINRLLVAADGSLWVATNNNLSRRTRDGQWLHYGPGNPFQSDIQVAALAQDTAGAVWVGTRGEGVYRFMGNAWTQFRPGIGGVKLPSSDVISVTPLRDGSIWFGTAGAGAARFDGASWQAFTVADGLINPFVFDVYQDQTGAVWFATYGGVTEYQP